MTKLEDYCIEGLKIVNEQLELRGDSVCKLRFHILNEAFEFIQDVLPLLEEHFCIDLEIKAEKIIEMIESLNDIDIILDEIPKLKGIKYRQAINQESGHD